MTDSRCWIDLQEDLELANRLRAIPERNIDPARIYLSYRYLWINDLRSWAVRKGLPIEYPDMGWIVDQVTVDKQLLIEFLDEMLGAERAEPNPGEIDIVRAMVREYGNENCRYHILADEY